MIPLPEALAILSSIPVRLRAESVALAEALQRVLAHNIYSDVDMPMFDKSAMDGYAYRGDDPAERFRVIATMAAGAAESPSLQSGECVKIMTGAKIPAGADRVVRVENTVEEDGWMRITQAESHSNICPRGEDLHQGDLLLSQGTLLRPPQIALLAAAGMRQVPVHRRIKVGIVITGSELVEPGLPLADGSIYNSNGFTISALVQEMGAMAVPFGIVEDQRETIALAVRELHSTCDVVVLSGGVSAGDFDLVPSVLRDFGVQIHFEKVAVQPGMPTLFGSKEKTFYFGLPGNPVSTFVIGEILLKPFVWRLSGHAHHPVTVPAVLGGEITRRNRERTAFLPVLLHDGYVHSLPYHGSAHLHALSKAHGLLEIPAGVDHLPAGQTVHVRLL